MSGTVDALLVLSFGGPERPEDVLPFLENVTRGQGSAAGAARRGRRALSAFRWRLADQCAQPRPHRPPSRPNSHAAGIDLPVYFGNRNWHPMVEDTVATMRGRRRRPRPGVPDLGVGRLFRLPAVPRGHRRRARRRGRPDGARSDANCAQYFDHPLLIAAVRRRHRCGPSTGSRPHRGTTRGWCSPRTRSRTAADNAAGPPARVAVSTAVRWPRLRPIVLPRQRVSTTTTWCGSPGPDRRRCRGWRPTSSITSNRCRRTGVGAVVVCPSDSSPITSRSSGIWTTRRPEGRRTRDGLRPCRNSRAGRPFRSAWSPNWSMSS